MSLARAAALASLLATLGCARSSSKEGALPDDPCGAGHAPLIEVRDAQGALELALLAGAWGVTGGTLCDAGGHSLGTLATSATGLVLTLPAYQMTATRRSPTEDAQLTQTTHCATPGTDAAAHASPCAGYRLHESANLLRVLDPQGVPVGQLQGEAARAVIYDPAGRAFATAERVEKQDDARHAVRAADGKVLHIVIGVHDERAAAAFALAMPLSDRLLLARLLDAH